jgi:hypothetical protein
MRERSKPKADIPPDIPKVEVSAPPTSTVATDTETNPAVEAYQKEIEKADEAANALRVQLDALRTSEQINRARLEQMQMERQMRLAQMQPPTVEQRMEWLKQAGVSIGDRQMVVETPGMLDHLDVADYAANQALQAGHQRDTDSYRAVVRQNFQALMKHLQEEAAPVAGPFRPSPPPPPPPPPAPSPKANGAQYSAPISRDIPSSDPFHQFQVGSPSAAKRGKLLKAWGSMIKPMLSKRGSCFSNAPVGSFSHDHNPPIGPQPCRADNSRRRKAFLHSQSRAQPAKRDACSMCLSGPGVISSLGRCLEPTIPIGPLPPCFLAEAQGAGRAPKSRRPTPWKSILPIPPPRPERTFLRVPVSPVRVRLS